MVGPFFFLETMMPQYAFECPNCGTLEEFICTLAEKPDTVECAKCKAKMDWVPQVNGRVFKGRGWTPRFGPQ